jgi:hypothetical protein
MQFIEKFRIERLTDSNRTEFYTLFAGSEDWTTDVTDAVEFSNSSKAWARAERVGGSVASFERPATSYEAMMLSRPTTLHLIAAE